MNAGKTIDMKRDYWKEYYQLKRKIESGKGTREDYRTAREAYENAEAQGDQVHRNWQSIGINNR